MLSINFAKNTRGTTAVEFALLTPVLLYLVLGSIEFSLYLFVQSAIEGASYSASRVGKTGYIAEDMTREESIRASLDENLFFLNPELITIDTLTYTDFESVGSPEPFMDTNANGIHDDTENYTDVNGNGQYDEDVGLEGAGAGGDIVVYTISYPWSITTPFMQEFLGENVDITSRFIIKNEPF